MKLKILILKQLWLDTNCIIYKNNSENQVLKTAETLLHKGMRRDQKRIPVCFI